MEKASSIVLALVMMAATAQGHAQSAPNDTGLLKPKIKPIKGLAAVMSDSAATSALIAMRVLLSEPKSVRLVDELNSLFEQNNCKLDQDYLKKFKATQAKDLKVETAIPADVYRAIGSDALNSNVKKISDMEANAALHFFMIPVAGSNQKQRIYMNGPETYKSRSAIEFADSQMGDFAYATDCSGYLNAAISAGVSAPFGKTDGYLKNALSQKFSTIVMRSHVYAPAAAAMNPDIGGSELSKAERLDILFAIIAELNDYALNNNVTLDDNLRISAWSKVDLLWASNDGQSTYSGNIDIRGGGGGGFGVATMTAEANSGASVARRVSYKTVNTYVLAEDSDKETERSFQFLKDSLVEGFSWVRPSAVNVVNSKTIELLVPDIRRKACEKGWTPTVSGLSNPGEVTTSAKKEGCMFIFTPSASIQAGTTVKMSAAMMKTPKLDIAWSFQSPQFTK